MASRSMKTTKFYIENDMKIPLNPPTTIFLIVTHAMSFYEQVLDGMTDGLWDRCAFYDLDRIYCKRIKQINPGI